MYPDPPPPLALEPVEELPGECWDDIPLEPGPGPGGDDTFVAELVPWPPPLLTVPPLILGVPPDPLTVNCILTSAVPFLLAYEESAAPLTSDLFLELTGGSFSSEFKHLVVSSLV